MRHSCSEHDGRERQRCDSDAIPGASLVGSPDKTKEKTSGKKPGGLGNDDSFQYGSIYLPAGHLRKDSRLRNSGPKC